MEDAFKKTIGSEEKERLGHVEPIGPKNRREKRALEQQEKQGRLQAIHQELDQSQKTHVLEAVRRSKIFDKRAFLDGQPGMHYYIPNKDGDIIEQCEVEGDRVTRVNRFVLMGENPEDPKNWQQASAGDAWIPLAVLQQETLVSEPDTDPELFAEQQKTHRILRKNLANLA